MSGQIRSYTCKSDRIPELIRELTSKLMSKGYTCQSIELKDTHVLQARKTAWWRFATGTGTAATIVFKVNGPDNVIVEVGEGEWADKATVGIVSFIVPVLWPITITTLIGLHGQYKLPDNIFTYLDSYINGFPMGCAEWEESPDVLVSQEELDFHLTPSWR